MTDKSAVTEPFSWLSYFGGILHSEEEEGVGPATPISSNRWVGTRSFFRSPFISSGVEVREVGVPGEEGRRRRRPWRRGDRVKDLQNEEKLCGSPFPQVHRGKGGRVKTELSSRRTPD